MKAVLFANTDWYLFNFRSSLAEALRDAGAEVVLISPPGPYGPRFLERGFRWIPVSMERRSLKPFEEIRVIGSITNIYRRERPDIVHHFTLKCVIYGSIAAMIAGVRGRVNAVTGLGFVFSSRSYAARILRPIVKAILMVVLRGEESRLIVQNPDDYELFVDAGLVGQNATRLIRSSGVDSKEFQPRVGERRSGPVRVLLATRLLWDKGLGEFAVAASIIRAKGIGAEFLVAGAPDAGNPAAVPLEQMEKWKDEGTLKMLGHVEDMRSLMRDVDVVCLPTSYGEGVPRVLIEAAACGLPMVATDVPGCREVVSPEENGLLVPAGDAGALAQALERLCSDEALRSGMGQVSRQKAISEFDERIVLRQTLDVYREILGQVWPKLVEQKVPDKG